MGLSRLREFLRRHRLVGLDTNTFIYELEGNPRYLSLTIELFSWLAQPGSGTVTSTLTMTELLVGPHRKGDEQSAEEFYARMSAYPNLTWIAPTPLIADSAARLRARHQLRTPDAVQAATAVHSGATAFITNDPVYRRVNAFETLVLESLL